MDAALFRINENGDLLWDRHFNLDQYAYSMSVKETSDNGFIMAGLQEYSFGADVYVIKTDSDGLLITSENNNSSFDINIFPNPTTGKINIVAEDIAQADLSRKPCTQSHESTHIS